MWDKLGKTVQDEYKNKLSETKAKYQKEIA